MHVQLSVDAVRPADLDEAQRTLWTRFRAQRDDLGSPYFDLRYVLAVAEVAPHAAVAVIRRAQVIEGFLPFQRRGGLIQPLGAPLTDYHGLIAPPGADIDLGQVLSALGGSRLRFSGLVGEAGEAAHDLESRHAMVADLRGGLEAYLDCRREAGKGGELKDKRRRARALARDHGEPDFTFGADPGGILELIVSLKRAQMRRTGQHDVFANPWTRQVLEQLAQAEGEDFGLRFAVLRVGGKVIAAEVGLRSGEAYHLWIPVYDPAFARYSPGALMTLETLAAAAAEGVRMVDFGPVDEAYKRVFAEPGVAVWEGQLHAEGGLSSGVWRTSERLFAPLPMLRGAWRSALRRLDRIAACEPTLNGQMGAAARTIAILGSRHPRKALILGLAASINLSLFVFD